MGHASLLSLPWSTRGELNGTRRSEVEAEGAQDRDLAC